MQTPQVDPEAQRRLALAERWGAGPLEGTTDGCRVLFGIWRMGARPQASAADENSRMRAADPVLCVGPLPL